MKCFYYIHSQKTAEQPLNGSICTKRYSKKSKICEWNRTKFSFGTSKNLKSIPQRAICVVCNPFFKSFSRLLAVPQSLCRPGLQGQRSELRKTNLSFFIKWIQSFSIVCFLFPSSFCKKKSFKSMGILFAIGREIVTLAKSA